MPNKRRRIKPHTETTEKYWKKFEPELDEDGAPLSQINSDIEIDVDITFRGMNGIIYQTREKGINCNPEDLDLFMDNLKKVIQMLDETKCDAISDYLGSSGGNF